MFNEIGQTLRFYMQKQSVSFNQTGVFHFIYICKCFHF